MAKWLHFFSFKVFFPILGLETVWWFKNANWLARLHTLLTLAFKRQAQMDLCVCEASLIYIANSKLA